MKNRITDSTLKIAGSSTRDANASASAVVAVTPIPNFAVIVSVNLTTKLVVFEGLRMFLLRAAHSFNIIRVMPGCENRCLWSYNLTVVTR
jgi:hypothetical protein